MIRVLLARAPGWSLSLPAKDTPKDAGFTADVERSGKGE